MILTLTGDEQRLYAAIRGAQAPAQSAFMKPMTRAHVRNELLGIGDNGDARETLLNALIRSAAVVEDTDGTLHTV